MLKVKHNKKETEGDSAEGKMPEFAAGMEVPTAVSARSIPVIIPCTYIAEFIYLLLSALSSSPRNPEKLGL